MRYIFALLVLALAACDCSRQHSSRQIPPPPFAPKMTAQERAERVKSSEKEAERLIKSAVALVEALAGGLEKGPSDLVKLQELHQKALQAEGNLTRAHELYREVELDVADQEVLFRRLKSISDLISHVKGWQRRIEDKL
jgi:hypothetical protein